MSIATSTASQPLQRLQVTFTRGEEIRFLSHLDMMRLWERALRRAGLPIHYSDGFTPHAHIAIAVPLVVGVCSRGELMDVFMSRHIPPAHFMATINAVLPAGVRVTDVVDAPLSAPSLAARVRFANYSVLVDKTEDADRIGQRVDEVLASPSLPRERKRDKEIKRYDLRPLIETLRLAGEEDGRLVFEMTLHANESGSGRPDEVLRSLGLNPSTMSAVRTELILK